MKPKEIHDLLLSLLCRGIGFWLLYLAVDPVINLVDQVLGNFSGVASESRTGFNFVWDVIMLVVKIALPAYFILGAPPFLKWATRNRD